MALIVTPIPCLTDNYAYLVRESGSDTAAVVDPSEPGPVRAALEAARVKLTSILCTHHHHDHVGGVEALLAEANGSVDVFAHESERARIPSASRLLGDNASITLGGLSVRVMHVPGHTLGAVGYVVAGSAVFTGDTLFAGGCGRLFEGTPAMMAHSINVRFGSLGDAVEIYPGHEYAEKNLRFARSIEPENLALAARYESVCARRSAGEFCVPSSLGVERQTNPYFRLREPEVCRWASAHGADPSDPVAVLAAIRAARDAY